MTLPAPVGDAAGPTMPVPGGRETWPRWRQRARARPRPTSPTAPSSAASTSPPSDLAMPRAEAGDTAAQTLLGADLRGRLRRAARFRRSRPTGMSAPPRAATAKAQFALGKMYLEGRGVPADRAKAADVFRDRCRARQGRRDVQSGAPLPRGPGLAARPCARCANCSRTPRRPATPTPSTCWRNSTTTGRGVPEDKQTGDRTGSPRRAHQATFRPRSNTPSACSTASASRRTRPPPPSGSAAPPISAIRSPRTAWRASSPPGAASPADPVEAAKWHYLASQRRQGRRLPRRVRRRADTPTSASWPSRRRSAGPPTEQQSPHGP